MKILFASMLATVALCSSCAQKSLVEQTGDIEPLVMECPVYESLNWHAWIDQLDTASGTGRLNVNGLIELPSPGYTIEYHVDSVDNGGPPSMNIELKISPPKGMSIQVITTESIQHSTETKALRLQSVTVSCGDKQLAEMVDVMPTE